MVALTDSRKFSPSKFSRYIVPFYTYMHIHVHVYCVYTWHCIIMLRLLPTAIMSKFIVPTTSRWVSIEAFCVALLSCCCLLLPGWLWLEVIVFILTADMSITAVTHSYSAAIGLLLPAPHVVLFPTSWGFLSLEDYLYTRTKRNAEIKQILYGRKMFQGSNCHVFAGNQLTVK